MIDFDALVLAPCEAVFGRVVKVNPIRSQRGAEPYDARAIFNSRSVDVAADNGVVFSDQQTTLGIRFKDFAVAPVADDRVTVNGVEYEVTDVNEDGEGGAELPLRRVTP